MMRISCPYCIDWGHLVEVFSSGWLHRCPRCCRDIPRQVVRVPIKLKQVEETPDDPEQVIRNLYKQFGRK